ATPADTAAPPAPDAPGRGSGQHAPGRGIEPHAPGQESGQHVPGRGIEPHAPAPEQVAEMIADLDRRRSAQRRAPVETVTVPVWVHVITSGRSARPTARCATRSPR
ncbi:hypothetical protein, partial [Planomonospora algeriensis]